MGYQERRLANLALGSVPLPAGRGGSSRDGCQCGGRESRCGGGGDVLGSAPSSFPAVTEGHMAGGLSELSWVLGSWITDQD